MTSPPSLNPSPNPRDNLAMGLKVSIPSITSSIFSVFNSEYASHSFSGLFNRIKTLLGIISHPLIRDSHVFKSASVSPSSDLKSEFYQNVPQESIESRLSSVIHAQSLEIFSLKNRISQLEIENILAKNLCEEFRIQLQDEKESKDQANMAANKKFNNFSNKLFNELDSLSEEKTHLIERIEVLVESVIGLGGHVDQQDHDLAFGSSIINSLNKNSQLSISSVNSMDCSNDPESYSALFNSFSCNKNWDFSDDEQSDHADLEDDLLPIAKKDLPLDLRDSYLGTALSTENAIFSKKNSCSIPILESLELPISKTCFNSSSACYDNESFSDAEDLSDDGDISEDCDYESDGEIELDSGNSNSMDFSSPSNQIDSLLSGGSSGPDSSMNVTPVFDSSDVVADSATISHIKFETEFIKNDDIESKVVTPSESEEGFDKSLFLEGADHRDSFNFYSKKQLSKFDSENLTVNPVDSFLKYLRATSRSNPSKLVDSEWVGLDDTLTLDSNSSEECTIDLLNSDSDIEANEKASPNFLSSYVPKMQKEERIGRYIRTASYHLVHAVLSNAPVCNLILIVEEWSASFGTCNFPKAKICSIIEALIEIAELEAYKIKNGTSSTASLCSSGSDFSRSLSPTLDIPVNSASLPSVCKSILRKPTSNSEYSCKPLSSLSSNFFYQFQMSFLPQKDSLLLPLSMYFTTVLRYFLMTVGDGIDVLDLLCSFSVVSDGRASLFPKILFILLQNGLVKNSSLPVANHSFNCDFLPQTELEEQRVRTLRDSISKSFEKYYGLESSVIKKSNTSEIESDSENSGSFLRSPDSISSFKTLLQHPVYEPAKKLDEESYGMLGPFLDGNSKSWHNSFTSINLKDRPHFYISEHSLRGSIESSPILSARKHVSFVVD
ncbi:hypothetical protein AYI68_g8028 [Smittium mucronatum]|uniref:Uncharacterized protein n=1 Tax=Smittium mucronatum TaxID=133383 RepID=A0A1R0GM04_9FUNG|nr:hypothetical protein AYI68_g8028 [Smittium mucronatum]